MTTRCTQCGLESQVEAAFHVERDWFHKLPRAYCPTCQRQRVVKSTRKLMLNGLFIGGLGVVLLFSPDFHYLGVWLVSIFTAFLLCIPLIILHELAHAGVARLMGLRVFAIVIGYGKTWLKSRLGDMNWELKLFPLSGVTGLGTPPGRFFRVRLFLALLAGPTVHLVFAGLAWLALQEVGQASTLHRLLFILLFTNLVLLLISLYPTKVSSIYGETGTDGLELLRIPFWKPAEIDKRVSSYYIQEGMRAYLHNDMPTARRWVDEGMARYPDSQMIQNGLGFLLFHTGQYSAARQAFVKLLEGQQNPPPEIKYMAMNNIAYANLFLNEAHFLAEAQQFSDEAYQNMPWIPSIAGTRGAVLVASGAIEAGLTLLKQAMADHDEPQSKALNACHIAIAEKQLGHVSIAEEYLHAARALDPHCFLLARAESELGQGPSIQPDANPVRLQTFQP